MWRAIIANPPKFCFSELCVKHGKIANAKFHTAKGKHSFAPTVREIDGISGITGTVTRAAQTSVSIAAA